MFDLPTYANIIPAVLAMIFSLVMPACVVIVMVSLSEIAEGRKPFTWLVSEDITT